MFSPASDYEQGILDEFEDLTTVNTYEPAVIIQSGLRIADSPRLSVRLNNRGVGNIYEDKDFDPFIIKKNHDPISETKLWCKLNDYFYVGFHTRNTKRIPYKCDVIIGEEVLLESTIKDGTLNTTRS